MEALKSADTFCQRWWVKKRKRIKIEIKSCWTVGHTRIEARHLTIHRNYCGKMHRMQHGFSIVACPTVLKTQWWEDKMILFLPQWVTPCVACPNDKYSSRNAAYWILRIGSRLKHLSMPLNLLREDSRESPMLFNICSLTGSLTIYLLWEFWDTSKKWRSQMFSSIV